MSMYCAFVGIWLRTRVCLNPYYLWGLGVEVSAIANLCANLMENSSRRMETR